MDGGIQSIDPRMLDRDPAHGCAPVTLKVNAVLNEIRGRRHDGKAPAPVPQIFGMNFQAVSVGEKLIEYNDNTKTIVATGGYQDAFGTPTASRLSENQFVDASIDAFMDALREQGLEQSTLVVITAKHGQSPIDPNRVKKIPSPNTPADIIASLLPTSEIDPNGLGPTQDDVSLLSMAEGLQPNRQRCFHAGIECGGRRDR